jgi:hypothetical protein
MPTPAPTMPTPAPTTGGLICMRAFVPLFKCHPS